MCILCGINDSADTSIATPIDTSTDTSTVTSSDAPGNDAPIQLHLSLRDLVSLTGLLLFAFGASLGMAFNIDAIALSFEVSNARAGSVASAEMASIAAGTLLLAPYTARVQVHRLYLATVGVITLCNLLSLLAPSVFWLTCLRVPAGLALGALVATVMSTAGRSDRPEHTFGIINAAVGLMGIVVALVLPRALGLGERLPAAWNLSAVDGLYATYTLAALIALCFLRSTPRPPPLPHSGGQSGSTSLPARYWLALLGLGALFFGHGLLGVFLVRIGREAQLSPAAIGYVLMVAGAVGVVAPLVSGYVGARFASVWTIAALVLALLLLVPILGGVHTPLAFIASAPLFAGLPIAVMPVFLGAAATVEPTGRIAGAHPAFIMIGGALAPLAGGLLSDAGGFRINAAAAAVCLVLGYLAMLSVLRESDAARRRLRSA